MLRVSLAMTKALEFKPVLGQVFTIFASSSTTLSTLFLRNLGMLGPSS